jgi:hypothetical protein
MSINESMIAYLLKSGTMSLKEAIYLIGTVERLVNLLACRAMVAQGAVIDPSDLDDVMAIASAPVKFILAAAWLQAVIDPERNQVRSRQGKSDVLYIGVQICQCAFLEPARSATDQYTPRYLKLAESVGLVGSQDDVLNALRDGALRAEGMCQSMHDCDPYQPHTRIDPHEWKEGDVKWSYSGLSIDQSITGREGGRWYEQVRIERDNLFQVFPACNNATPTPAKKKQKVGRPPDHDWESIISEAWRRIYVGDAKPNTLAEFARDMESWCFDKWGKAPDISKMRDHLRNIYQTYRS